MASMTSFRNWTVIICIIFAVLPTAFPLRQIAFTVSRFGTPKLSAKYLRCMTMNGDGSEKLSIYEPAFKGLMGDIKRKAPHILSEYTDGFNLKSVSTTFFLFFACLAPAVAFGGLLGIATNGAMGTVETVGATAIGGVLYALLSAQPLTIIGTTGPLLAFLKVVYESCAAKGIPFLPVYSWIGLWSSLLLFLSSVFSTSNIVESFTRFTDDIFSSLISVIFIVEAFKDIIGNFLNPSMSGLQACIALIVAMTTYATTTAFAGLRKTPYFTREIRTRLADFAPTIGVLAGVSASKALMDHYSCSLKMLAVPQVLSTTSGRPWLVDIFSVSNEIKLVCFLPALMATILLFMDQNITVRLMMAKENKLRKGSGLHLDMFVISLVTAITSVLGMPWMVAATVRSLAHMRSLKLYKQLEPTEAELQTTQTCEVPAVKLEVTGVQEQRVTGLAIHSLIGAAIIFSRDLLRQIPVAVLTGLFLYLGASSIGTTDMFERTKLFISDDRDVPRSAPWFNDVGLLRTKIFTSLQVALLTGMWWIKGTSLGVFFPVLIGALAPIRVALEKFGWFSKKELEALDGEIA